MRKILIITALMVFVFSQSLFAYDKEMAKSFDMMFSQMTPEVIAKKPCMVDSKQLFEMIKNKEPFVILDVRTREEMAIIGVTWKDRLEIPMNELFKEANLNRLPKDKKIVVICHTGTRAIAVTFALRALGFMNAYAFDGGVAELAKETGRKAFLFVH